MISTVNLLAAAKEYTDLGFSVLPVGEDKRPTCGGWKHLKDHLPGEEDLQHFDDTSTTGIGIICGNVSVSLECLDIDCKYDLQGNLYEEFIKVVQRADFELYEKLVIARTRNAGYHIIYRCPDVTIPGNQKLAKRPTTEQEREETYQKNIDKGKTAEEAERQRKNDNSRVLLETRGEAGYFLVNPSPGYEFLQGDIYSIPLISKEQRQLLMDIAKAFDEQPPKATDEKHQQVGLNGSASVLDDYNAKQDIVNLLESWGWQSVWTRGIKTAMLRPGDSDAKYSGYYYQDNNRFYCHSSSTEFPQEETLSAAALYAYHHHNGDFKATAKALRAEGYGIKVDNININSAENDTVSFSIDTAKPEPLICPVDALPKELAAIAKEASEATNHPIDFYMAGILAAASTALGNRARLRLKAGWEEPAILYTALVGAPGTGKTPALNFCLKPIRNHQAKLSKQFESEISEYAVRQQEYEADKENKDKPIRPKPSQAIGNEFTIEAIYEMLNNNPMGILIHRDELISWINTFNQYRKGADEQFWLSAWSYQPITLNRKANEQPIFIEKPFINVVGGIQPAVLEDLFSGKREHNGFVDRILFAYPDEQRAKHWSHKSISNQVFEAYNKHISKLFSMPSDVVLSAQENQILEDYYNSIVDKANAEENEQIKSMYHKVITHFARIALVLEMLKDVTGEIPPTRSGNPISDASLQNAKRITEYYIQSAIKVYNSATPKIPDNVYQTADLLKQGVKYDKIAENLGISKGTITKWKKKYPVVFR